MRDRTPWLRMIGGVWLLAGALVLLWAIASLLHVSPMRLIPFFRDSSARAVIGAFFIWPWAQITAIVCAAFLAIIGLGLIRRQRWVQTVVVPAHLLFVVYTVVGWIAAFMIRDRSPTGWAFVSFAFAVSVLANGGLALFMNSVGATEALSWLPLRTTPLVPLRCEFCGTPLDPRTNRCPQCEAIPEIVHEHVGLRPPLAKLVGLADEAEFRIGPDKPVLVGRGSTRNDVNLSNPTVSRHHAQIAYEGEHYVLTALRDLNGTFINDTLIRKRTLRDGDEVRFGRARFRFTILESE